MSRISSTAFVSGWTRRAEGGDLENFEAGTSDESAVGRDFGIIDLVEEFTALRHEVKLQTKSGRGLSEQTETTLEALKRAIEEVKSVVPRDAQAVWAAGKALAEGLADLDEALHRGEREIARRANKSPCDLQRRLRLCSSGSIAIGRGFAAGCTAATTTRSSPSSSATV